MLGLALAAALGRPAASTEPLFLKLVREDLLARINKARTLEGLVPFGRQPALDQAAQAGSWRVIEETAGGFSRRGRLPEPAIPQESLKGWLREAGYEPHRAEAHWIVTKDAVETALDDVIFGDRDSEVLKGLLDPGLRELGIGLAGWDSRKAIVLVPALSRTLDFEIRTAPLSDLERVRAELLVLSNAARETRGRRPLRPNDCLERAAQRYAERMLEGSFFGHVSPDLKDAMDRARAEGCLHPRIAENLAEGLDRPSEAVESWLESPGHRANLLDRIFGAVGFGLAVGRNEQGFRILWVQLLGAT